MDFAGAGVVPGMLGLRMWIGLVIVGAAVIVRIVQRMLDMLGRRPARTPEEGQEPSRQL
jgi:uncharacterized membrane protein YkvI